MFKQSSAVVGIFLACSSSTLAGGHISTAVADLIDANGKIIGEATAEQGPNGVLLHVRVSDLPPGKHGLHLHSHGVCDTDQGFKTAHGHVGKVEGAHGLMNPNGPEPGDLPNLFVGADGIGEMEAFTTLVSVDGGQHALLDEDGSTFIIHEKGDDHISQPIGGAGGRIACGVLKAK